MSNIPHPLWVDGVKYHSASAFLASQGVNNVHFKRATSVIKTAATEGKPFVLDGFRYAVSFTNPETTAQKIARITKTAARPHKHRLMACVTDGLHQDRGEHYA